MNRNRKELGYYGEAVARKALEKQGYRLREKNFTIRGGEIDLIMEKGNELVFVEVKTRRSQSYGSPLESVTPQKQKRFLHAAEVYLSAVGLTDPDVRFFAVGVEMGEGDRVKKVEILKDIFC